MSELRRSAKARAAAGGAVAARVLLAGLAGRHPAWSTGVGRRSFVGGATGYALTVLVLALAVALVAAYVRLGRQRRKRLTRSDLSAVLALLVGILVVEWRRATRLSAALEEVSAFRRRGRQPA